MENVINAPEHVTPKWLTSALRKNGFLKKGKVLNVRSTLTKTLVGSVVSRLEVEYSPDAWPPLPSKLFLKVSRPDLPPATASEINSKEIEFYHSIASEMDDPPFIRCYDASYSADSGESHLLLEDLSDTHFQPESPQPPSRSYCESAIECLAQLHAYWWEDRRLGHEVGKLFSKAELDAFVGDVKKNIVSFMDFLGDRLSTKQRKIYERLLASRYELWGRLIDAAGLTVTHGDAHW